MTDIGLIIAFIFGCLTIYYTLRDYRKGKITKKNYIKSKKSNQLFTFFNAFNNI